LCLLLFAAAASCSPHSSSSTCASALSAPWYVK
jgi:hypothetical protein